MWKFIVIVLASLFCLGVVVHYVPVVQEHAFFLGGNSISWSMLLGVGFVVCGYKVIGKK
jgi:hypothetical protein